MSCDEANLLIEAVAVGDSITPAAEQHIASCPRCTARLALARRVDIALANRPVPAMPTDFTGLVLARLRHERWRAEQAVDVGFNVAVAAGCLLVLFGLAGFAWRAGALALTTEMAAAVFGATRAAAAGVLADAQLVTTVMLLLATAVALWWWAESDVTA